MRLTITDNLIARTANDGQSVVFAVKCWDDSAEPWTLTAPTTLRYRLDDYDTGQQIIGWTAGSASSSQTITVSGANNTPAGCESRYRRLLTVQINLGLSTVAVATRDFWVKNIGGVT